MRLYGEENCCTKTELLNFNPSLPLANLVMVGVRLTSNGLTFLGDTPVDIQLVTFLLLSNISKSSIGAKAKEL